MNCQNCIVLFDSSKPLNQKNPSICLVIFEIPKKSIVMNLKYIMQKLQKIMFYILPEENTGEIV